jgi:hypothetical protein
MRLKLTGFVYKKFGYKVELSFFSKRCGTVAGRE